MDAIADGAGVTSAAVYRHFHNKSDLRISVVERAIDSVPLSERLRGDTTRSVSDFSDLIAAYVDPALSTVPRQG